MSVCTERHLHSRHGILLDLRNEAHVLQQQHTWLVSSKDTSACAMLPRKVKRTQNTIYMQHAIQTQSVEGRSIVLCCYEVRLHFCTANRLADTRATLMRDSSAAPVGSALAEVPNWRATVGLKLQYSTLRGPAHLGWWAPHPVLCIWLLAGQGSNQHCQPAGRALRSDARMLQTQAVEQLWHLLPAAGPPSVQATSEHSKSSQPVMQMAVRNVPLGTCQVQALRLSQVTVKFQDVLQE